MGQIRVINAGPVSGYLFMTITTDTILRD